MRVAPPPASHCEDDLLSASIRGYVMSIGHITGDNINGDHMVKVLSAGLSQRDVSLSSLFNEYVP